MTCVMHFDSSSQGELPRRSSFEFLTFCSLYLSTQNPAKSNLHHSLVKYITDVNELPILFFFYFSFFYFFYFSFWLCGYTKWSLSPLNAFALFDWSTQNPSGGFYNEIIRPWFDMIWRGEVFVVTCCPVDTYLLSQGWNSLWNAHNTSDYYHTIIMYPMTERRAGWWAVDSPTEEKSVFSKLNASALPGSFERSTLDKQQATTDRHVWLL